jgi:catechol 2,3-dioxygenase-like lactoylglutathione lyase family enzyme
MTIESLSAVTLATHDMARAVEFYRSLGFLVTYGGPEAPFTSFRAGSGYLNLIVETSGREWSWWGRAIFHVASVDETYQRALAAGFEPEAAPADAEWGERYFHITDPDGHELSFARPLQ